MGLFKESVNDMFNESLDSTPYEYELTKSPRGQDMFANFEDEDGVAYRVEFVGSGGIGTKAKRVRIRQNVSGRTYRDPMKRFKDPMRVMSTMVSATTDYLTSPIGRKVEGLAVEFSTKAAPRGKKFIAALLKRNPKLKSRLDVLDVDFTVEPSKGMVWAVRKGKNPEEVFNGDKVSGMLGKDQVEGGQATKTVDQIEKTNYPKTLAGMDQMLEDLREAEDVDQDFFYYLGNKGFDGQWIKGEFESGVQHVLSIRNFSPNPTLEILEEKAYGNGDLIFHLSSKIFIAVGADGTFSHEVVVASQAHRPGTFTSIVDCLGDFTRTLENAIGEFGGIFEEYGDITDQDGVVLYFKPQASRAILNVSPSFVDKHEISSSLYGEHFLRDEDHLESVLQEIQEEMNMSEETQEPEIRDFVTHDLNKMGFEYDWIQGGGATPDDPFMVVTDENAFVKGEKIFLYYEKNVDLEMIDETAYYITIQLVDRNRAEIERRVIPAHKFGKAIYEIRLYNASFDDEPVGYTMTHAGLPDFVEDVIVGQGFETKKYNNQYGSGIVVTSDELLGSDDISIVIFEEMGEGRFDVVLNDGDPVRQFSFDLSSKEEFKRKFSRVVNFTLDMLEDESGDELASTDDFPSHLVDYPQRKEFDVWVDDGMLVCTHPDLGMDYQIRISETPVSTIRVVTNGQELGDYVFKDSSPFDFKMKFDQAVGQLYMAYNDAQVGGRQSGSVEENYPDQEIWVNTVPSAYMGRFKPRSRKFFGGYLKSLKDNGVHAVVTDKTAKLTGSLDSFTIRSGGGFGTPEINIEPSRIIESVAEDISNDRGEFLNNSSALNRNYTVNVKNDFRLILETSYNRGADILTIELRLED